MVNASERGGVSADRTILGRSEVGWTEHVGASDVLTPGGYLSIFWPRTRSRQRLAKWPEGVTSEGEVIPPPHTVPLPLVSPICTLGGRALPCCVNRWRARHRGVGSRAHAIIRKRGCVVGYTKREVLGLERHSISHGPRRGGDDRAGKTWHGKDGPLRHCLGPFPVESRPRAGERTKKTIQTASHSFPADGVNGGAPVRPTIL